MKLPAFLTGCCVVFLVRSFTLLLVVPAFAHAADSNSPVRAAGKIVQLDVSSLLNVRPVATLTQGKLVPWNFGIDPGSGYLTQAASLSVGDKGFKALPDNSLIPNAGTRPEILLHYANDDGTTNQAAAITDHPLVIPVQAAKYRAAFLAVTSSQGKSPITVTLDYSEGAPVTLNLTVPDYYTDIPAGDPTFSYLVHDLPKWNKPGKMLEKSHHNIDALKLEPDSSRKLVRITILKPASNSRLLFWAATGIAAKQDK